MADGCAHRQAGTLCRNCWVRQLSVCAALVPEELCALERISRPIVLASREPLFSQGDKATSVFNVTGGTLRLSKLLRNGRRQIVGFALPGDFLGLSVQAAFPFSAEAIGVVSACKFRRDEHGALVDAKPHFLQRLHEYATHELTLAQEQIVLLGRGTAEEKVAAFLLALRWRWARLNGGEESVTIALPMSRQDIADYLGLTIETVSRMISRLARSRILAVVPDGVRVLDVERLTSLAAS